MQLIQTVTVGAGGQANIEFLSIPQTYTDLVIITSLRDSSGSTGWSNAYVYPNASSANMSGQMMYGFGSTTGAGTTAYLYHELASGGNTANCFSNSSVYIANYAASTNKGLLADTSVERNTANAINAMGFARWSDTTAITSIRIVPETGTLVQYSSASLYGITKGSDGIVTVS